jgi:hypothetical protein
MLLIAVGVAWIALLPALLILLRLRRDPGAAGAPMPSTLARCPAAGRRHRLPRSRSIH